MPNFSQGKTTKQQGQQLAAGQAPIRSRQPGFVGPQAGILALQRAGGNRAVTQLLQSVRFSLQPKLAIGSVNDPLEHEADRVAEQVMRMPDSAFSTDARAPQVRRKCAACEEETRKLQTKLAGLPEPVASEAPPIVDEVLRSPGDSLDPKARAFAETRFGYDFSSVRVHTDSKAGQSAQAVNARAFTVGKDLVFAPGQYAPATSGGRRLLAHELAHVVQQTGHATTARPMPSEYGPATRSAEATSDPGVGKISRSAIPMVQRDSLETGAGALIGKQWLRLPRTLKETFIDEAIDLALGAIEKFPGKELLGGVWEFVKEGLIGFYGKLKAAAVEIKIRAIDKVAAIFSGEDKAFTLAYLKGLLKGFFIDGALGIFIAIWDLIQGIGKLWDFIKGIGEAIGKFPEEIESLIQRLMTFGEELAANIGPAIDQIRKETFDPQQASSLLSTIVEKGKGLAKEAGGKLADSLLNFFAKPEASAEIGEAVGGITGQILWEVVFAAFTAGVGGGVTVAKTAIKEATGILGKLVRRIVTGVLKIVAEVRTAFGKVAEWVKGAIKAVKGKLSEVGGRFAKLLEDVGEFFAKLVRNCHESKFECDLPGKKAIKAAEKATRAIPQGFTEQSFKRFARAARQLRKEAGLPGKGELVVHGSRVQGTAKAASDIDVALRVDEKTFFELAEKSLSRTRPDTRLRESILHRVRQNGQLSSFDLGPEFQRLRHALLDPESPIEKLQFSVLKEGGLLDTGPFLPLE